MKKATEPSSNGSSLPIELANRITRMLHGDAVAVGSRLNEKRLAEVLGVSRTPVRAALGYLEDQGFVLRKPNQGVELIAMPPLPSAEGSEEGQDDALLVRIAAGRHEGVLADQVAEQDVMQAYGLTRAAAKNALARLADLGVVERNMGYRWKFLDGAYDAQAKAEAYRFRLLVEPAGLLEPGFALPAGWAADMVAKHQDFLEARWTTSSGVAFFEMNAAFHEGLAKASGNRFFVDAVSRLNRLRRLANYDWQHGRERVGVSCREHIEILQALETGNVGHGAHLMRQHLELASRT